MAMDKSEKHPGLYRPEFEHDACGVGIVADIKGRKSHDLVSHGMEVLRHLAHRGAEGSDPETGDGAGVLIQIPHEFFSKRSGVQIPEAGSYGVGMAFLPSTEKERKHAEQTIERVSENEGLEFLGWRSVDVDNSQIGSTAKNVEPVIKQFFVGEGGQELDQLGLERKLYVVRKVVESELAKGKEEALEAFYICSLSTKTIVYKGLVTGTQLDRYFRDLKDPLLQTGFAMVHSRFSTNTLGSWKLAHPYRYVSHNGEINTLRGNINWMVAREALLESPLFGKDIKKLFPTITPNASDTASFDNLFELLVLAGRSLPHAMMMMIPEAWNGNKNISREKRAFYEYHATLMEPWDGPALMAFTDGERIGANLDRNGLRPFRYTVTKDDLLIMASETGVLDVPPEKVLYKGRLRPGRIFLLDTERGRIIDDEEMKAEITARQPYHQWVETNMFRLEQLPEVEHSPPIEETSLTEREVAFGYTAEEMRLLIWPMAVSGGEPIGSMGNDTPLAALSSKPQLVFNYFKQLFAQVTNPPLDAIREDMVTSLEMWLGSEGNLLEETARQASQLKLPHPVLTNEELERIRRNTAPTLKTKTLSTLFDPELGDGAMQKALDLLLKGAISAVKEGNTIIVLSDRGSGPKLAPIPSLLATSAVHHHLIREGLRMKTGIIVESGEPREVQHFALLIGYGAGAVNPYLVFEILSDSKSQEYALSDSLDFKTAQKNFIKATNKGLQKIASKMGISTMQSYRGAQIFEAIGLSQELIDRYFTWTPSRIGGAGISVIQEESLRRHARAYHQPKLSGQLDVEVGGVYQWRRDGEYHMWNPNAISLLQHASKTGDYTTYKRFAELADEYERNLCTLRGLLDFKRLDKAISLDEVESAKEIVKRFATGAISLGAISKEAHETLAIAMNRIDAKSNTGEGGEDYERYTQDLNGDSRSSAIKQVASGRFGVTTNYLVNASDLQIKMAQGSKPGEGGQLPGHKVDEYIGWVRRTTPGVELISPPPHHDIYSIEDLAQLIHDLKNVNPAARIHVKLVAEVGVGTIAAGVSKGHADVVLISGDSGGTGASPESSIKHAGLPWELGIAETQQVLVQNDLRGRIVVQADGQLKTGRDVAIACLLGAEEFGFSTAPLITLGCIMLRKCHLNACSVGIATQDPDLRKQFAGQPEAVINYFFMVAQQLREIMADMGFRTVNEMVGRADRLESRSAIEHWKAKGIDLAPLLYRPEESNHVATYCKEEQNHGLEEAMDHELIRLANDALEGRGRIQASLPIGNHNRTVGAMLSGRVAMRYGEEGLPDDTIHYTLEGSAGQSFGAFLAKGVSLTLEGDANDYFGKGMSGGRLVAYPQQRSTFVAEENIIIGNVALYGATGGRAFVRGQAGERFAVRNSAAQAVVEGVGDHCCEYMTGGLIVVLGQTGRNFAAGMSGGLAFVLDEDGRFSDNCNMEMVDLESVDDPADQLALRQMIEWHLSHTGSETARNIIKNWKSMIPKFVKVMPTAYSQVLEKSQISQPKEIQAVLHG